MTKSNNHPTFATFCNFSNSKIVLYTQPIDKNISYKNESYKLNFQKVDSSGIVSDGTKKKITRIITSWIDSVEQFAKNNNKSKEWIKNQITFVTLTLPSKQMHSDKECNRLMLNEFMIYLKRKTSITAYLWVAEKQDNGNIHYHILTTKFINWQTIRRLWNNTLNKNGYIEVYRKNQKEWHKNGFRVREDLLTRIDKKTKQIVDNWTVEKQREAYEIGVKENWSNPNSTDIHSMKNTNSIKKYLIKYMTKGVNEECKTITKKAVDENKTKKEIKELICKHIKEKHKHKILNCNHWNSSDNLKKLDRYVCMVNHELDEIIKNAIRKNEKSLYRNEYCTIVNDLELEDFKKLNEYHYKNLEKINTENFEKVYLNSELNDIFAMQLEEDLGSVAVQPNSNITADRKMKSDNKFVTLFLFNQNQNQNHGKENFNTYKKSRIKSRTKTSSKKEIIEEIIRNGGGKASDKFEFV